MLLKEALKRDGSIVAMGLSWNSACELNSDAVGPHSRHVSEPGRYRMMCHGYQLKGMSTFISSNAESGSDIRLAFGRKQLSSTFQFSLPLSGEQELRSLDGTVLSNKDRAIVYSAEQPFEVLVAGNCRRLVLTMPRSAIEQELSNILGRRVDDMLVFSESMDAVNGPGAAWWRTVKHCFEENVRSRELYGCGYFNQAIETALVRGLLVSQQSNYSAQIQQALSPKIPAYVSRAKSFIEANYHEPIRLEDIEAAAGVSRLKLFETFRKRTGLTPVAYVKDYRLRQARAELLQDRSHQNVSSIALSVGFNHLGRFAIDYKQAFSETPSETLRRNAR